MRFKRRKLSVIPPYVAMADIAFNLVLFFLILAKIQDDRNLKWDPASAVETKKFSNAKVSITVDDHDKVYLNGQEVGLRGLTERVAEKLGDTPPTERIVLLKIHKDT